MSPVDAIRQIALAAGLSPDHPPEVLAEAEALAASPGIDDPRLVDRTSLPLVTIDEEHSKDLDQAVFCERTGQGWRVWYAIADAAWYVRPGTALFDEALKRGTSFYLPGLVIPMLPRVLSEGVVSLNPGVDRRALLFVVDLDEAGEVVHSAIERARVRSRVKTWYDAVQEWLDGRRLCPGDASCQAVVAEGLRAMVEVGRLRLALAEARDVVRFRRRELSVHLDDGDAGFVGTVDLRNDIERYNEQISLLCNVVGAGFFVDAPPHVQAIFRTHDPPRDERLTELEHLVDGLVEAHDLDPERWRWNRGEQPLGGWLSGLPIKRSQARIVRALHRQALYSSGRAAFTHEPGPHFGIGAEVYARFTAPMREIVGVFAHKECWERLGLEPAPDHQDEALRDAIIAVSHEARQVQRRLDQQANRLVIDGLLAGDLERPAAERPKRRGTVMGISRGKVHVQLDDPPIDLKVYRFHLERQRGQRLFEGNDGATLREERTGDAVLRIGEPVDVAVVGHDVEHDRWELSLTVP